MDDGRWTMARSPSSTGRRPSSVPDDSSAQVVGQCVGYLHRHQITGPGAAAAEDQSIDLGRVAIAATGEERAAAAAIALRFAFQEDRQAPADLAPIAAEGYLVLERHGAVVALLHDLLGHLVRQVAGRRAQLARVLKDADAVEPDLAQEVQQEGELLLRLAGEADDEGRAQGDIRHR